MQAVHAAVEAGRCVVAVAAHLLRDPSVLLALRDRAAGLPAVALSGAATAPVRPIGADALARATGQADGVIVLVEPQDADWAGIEAVVEQVRASSFKPRVVLIGKPPQPLKFKMLFRGIALDEEKGRGVQFLKNLPIPDPAALPEVAVAEAPRKAAAPADVPRRVFVGRDDEVAALTALLGEGGPIVVSGPEGVGRNSLIDAAIEAAGLRRPLDVLLGRAAGFDMLAARLAQLADDAGAGGLAAALADPAANPITVAQAALDALAAAEGLAGTALVVQPLEAAAGRELDFFRKDALAFLVQRLLAGSYPLRLIFVAQGQPVAFDHESSKAVRRLEVGGIKGRFYHEIFDALKAGEVPREKFGPLSERLHGHPLAVRLFALEVRDRTEGAALLDDAKLLAARDLADTGAIHKRMQKRVDRLPEPLRAALARVAHLRFPATSADLNEIGVSRKDRIALVAAGVLDELGGDDTRRYRVHPIVSGCLKFREVADFDVLAEVGAHYRRKGSAAEGVDRIACAQEANRCFFAARRYREAISFRFPDHDPELDAIAGMMRSQKPHFEMARERLVGLVRARPGCADAHLLLLELMSRVDAPREVVDAEFEAAMTQAPVPEIFHDIATTLLGRKARGRAIEVLQRGIALLPDEVRFKTRLASLLLREGRRPEAVALLREAMEQAPMLPDAYGLLGMARFDDGEEAIADAEALLREAVRLAPNDPVQVPRLVLVLLARARVAVSDDAERLRAEARELLADMTRDERKSPEGFLMLARLEVEVGNLERADWLLEQARKRTDKKHERNLRIRLEAVLIAIARGELDQAEREARVLVERDKGNHRAFLALARVLEARGQLVPAHAELLRAAERVAPTSLDGRFVAAELERLQVAIQAEMASMIAGITMPAADDAPPVPKPIEAHRAAVVRRRKADDDAAEASGAGATTDAEPAVEAPAEAEPAAVDAEPETEPAASDDEG
jgi:tetratricopeptide (TPR) repeat protein